MKCEVVLHPTSQQRYLLETSEHLGAYGYVVPDQPGARFVRAIPESQVDAQITKKLRAVFPDWMKYFKEST